MPIDAKEWMAGNALEFLLGTALSHPAKTAVIDSDRSLTYGELVLEAAGIARRLPCGVDTAPVVVLLSKSAVAVSACLAAVMNGDFYSPLDVKSPPQRIQAMIEVLSPRAVITSRAHEHLVASLTLADVDVILVEDSAPVDLDIADVVSDVRQRIKNRDEADPIYVIYTSGSTGVPKGVTASHRNVINYIEWMREHFSVSEHDCIGNQAPLHFDISTADLYVAFATAASVVLLPSALFAFPSRLIEALERHSVTLVFWVPSAILKLACTGTLDRCALRHLRAVLLAGEVLPTRSVAFLMSRLPHTKFYNLYGPTETTVICTAYELTSAPPPDGTVPIGTPAANTTLSVLVHNDQGIREAAVGEAGELYIGGAGVCLGYFAAPDLTKRVFVKHPLNDRYPQRVYRTGDLVRLDEYGDLHFIGRRDDQIKHLGYRIELGDIEAAARAVVGVVQCCAMYDAATSELHLVITSDRDLSPRAMRAALAERLPRYMIPTRVHLHRDLPLLSNGKIDRELLRAFALGRASQPQREPVRGSSTKP